MPRSHKNSESSQVDVGRLGHSWVPCNRKSFPPVKYPLMSLFLPVSVSDVVLSTEAELWRTEIFARFIKSTKLNV